MQYLRTGRSLMLENPKLKRRVLNKALFLVFMLNCSPTLGQNAPILLDINIFNKEMNLYVWTPCYNAIDMLRKRNFLTHFFQDAEVEKMQRETDLLIAQITTLNAILIIQKTIGIRFTEETGDYALYVLVADKPHDQRQNVYEVYKSICVGAVLTDTTKNY